MVTKKVIKNNHDTVLISTKTHLNNIHVHAHGS